jgi:hypothetical protein
VAGPLILAYFGIRALPDPAWHTPADLGLLALGAAVSVGLGIWRGQIIQVWRDADSTWWRQGSARTLALWAALIVARALLYGLDAAVGHREASGLGAILLTLALSFAAQNSVTAVRMHAAPPLTPGRPAEPAAGHAVTASSRGSAHDRIHARRQQRRQARREARGWDEPEGPRARQGGDKPMTVRQRDRQPPAGYQIRVRGHLGATMRRALPALHAESQDGDTLLQGAIADQAALHGVLAQVEALGLELLEVRRLPASEPPAQGSWTPDADSPCRVGLEATPRHLVADATDGTRSSDPTGQRRGQACGLPPDDAQGGGHPPTPARAQCAP